MIWGVRPVLRFGGADCRSYCSFLLSASGWGILRESGKGEEVGFDHLGKKEMD